MVASRVLLLAFWPALLVAASTVLLGRAFCGWVCPLGSLIDAVDALLNKIRRRLPREADVPAGRHGRFFLLGVVVVLAVFGQPAAGWIDPLALWSRVVTALVVPYGELTVLAIAEAMANEGVQISAPAATHLIGDGPDGRVDIGIALLLASILLFGLVRRRFYCRYLCPTGGLLSLVGRLATLERQVAGERCSACRTCTSDCRMGAIHGDGRTTSMAECTLCMDCLEVDRCTVASFRFARRPSTAVGAPSSAPFPRRHFLAACGGGLVAGAGIGWRADAAGDPPAILRPPGVAAEEDFLALCVACGECIRICPTSGLRPLQLDKGVARLWTPYLVPTVGYCVHDCTLCGEVCPTGAVPRLSLATKQRQVIGVAALKREDCLAWTDRHACEMCHKLCPVGPNAIEMQHGGRFARPVVVQERCNGCGICEHLCPAEPRAIRVLPRA